MSLHKDVIWLFRDRFGHNKAQHQTRYSTIVTVMLIK